MSISTEFQTLPSGYSLTGARLRPLLADAATTSPGHADIVLRSLRNLAWITLLALAVPALALVDAQWIGSGSSEASATEVAQELLLLIAAGLFAVAAMRRAETRPILLLAAGLFATMLIRELDGFWDRIAHGAWVYPATAVAALAIWRASREQTSLLSSWATYAESKSYLLVSIGLLIVLVLSRTFGSQLMWRPILGNSDVSLTKTVIQEGLELFGYLFVFWGAVEVLSECPATSPRRTGQFATACDAIRGLFKRRSRI